MSAPVTGGNGTALRPSDRRLVALITETVQHLSLQLNGLTVLTEGATGAFAVSATLAAVAGADRVIAITRDSSYGTAQDAERQTRRVAELCGVEPRVDVITSLDAATVGSCDVITNLGFVRPLDATVVGWMKPTAVISLMCEAWEYRPGDVDLDACRARGILVLATNEHAAEMPVFRYCGLLAERMLRDAGVELKGTRVAVLGRDPFTPVITRGLKRAGAEVQTDDTLTRASALEAIAGAQAILVAEYATADLVLGDGGIVSAAEIAARAPGAAVVQFAGAIEPVSLTEHGIRVWPDPPVGPRRMSRTLAHLGVRPVIELHAAGLKVGQRGARARLAGLTGDAAVDEARAKCDLVQVLTPQAGSRSHAAQ